MFAKSVLGQVKQPIINAGWGWGRRFVSSTMMGKEEVVVIDFVEAVSSSSLRWLGRIVRTRLCALSKCEAIKVDMINPKNWLKWVGESIALL